MRARAVEGQTLVLDREAEQIHRLNETASYIWERCEGRTVDDIAGDLARDFEIDLATARKDVKDAVGRMQELGLLEAVEMEALDERAPRGRNGRI